MERDRTSFDLPKNISSTEIRPFEQKLRASKIATKTVVVGMTHQVRRDVFRCYLVQHSVQYVAIELSSGHWVISVGGEGGNHMLLINE